MTGRVLLAVAVVAVLCGAGLVVAGVWLAFGLPSALIGAGALLAAAGLLAVPVPSRRAAAPPELPVRYDGVVP